MARSKSIPKWIEKISACYTLLVLFELVLCLYFKRPVLIIFVIYLQAPLLWRLLKMFYGQPEGISYLGVKTKEGNLWWTAYHLQYLFNSFHFLEQILMLVPGLYSAWLRLWGSDIGKKVNWTPECRVVDRTHMKIGSRCLIGNRSYLAAHAIKKRDDRYLLYVKGVDIGDDVVLSYLVTVAPGAVIKSRSFIEAGSAVYPNENVES